MIVRYDYKIHLDIVHLVYIYKISTIITQMIKKYLSSMYYNANISSKLIVIYTYKKEKKKV